METENKPKNNMRIYEDQTQIQQFVEPEWMKILRGIIESNSKMTESPTMAKNHSIMVKNG
ncbi:MAG: hypothetical protein AABX17_01840 [Nanoarchaeota archaeon]